MSEEVIVQEPSVITYEELTNQQKIDVKLDIIDETLRRKELARLTEMQVVPFEQLNLPPLEEDIINNVRLFKINEMVYQKGEAVTDKYTTVFNTLQTYQASVFVIIDSDGYQTDFYLGVRSNGDKRSTVTLGDTLKNTLIGHFPGAKVQNEDRKRIMALTNKITHQKNSTSVSVVAKSKSNYEQENEQFIQGLDKLALSMQGRQFTGVIVAQNTQPDEIQMLRKNYQDLYTNLSPYQKIQLNETQTSGESRSKSFSEMSGKQRAALIASSTISMGASIVGGVIGGVATAGAGGIGAGPGAMVGGQIGTALSSTIQSLAPIETLSSSSSISTTTTTENKSITEMLAYIDRRLESVNEYDSYGMWQVAGYFMSDDMSSAEIAASNYRSLMNGEDSGREVSAINSWRSSTDDYQDLNKYISRFVHPQLIYGGDVYTTPATTVSGKDLGIHLGLPRQTVPGLPVIEHAEFGKEVTTYQLFQQNISHDPKDNINLGKIFDLGKITNRKVALANKSLNMHTFITGSTGSGKSNTVYQLLNELHQDDIPFLVIEPAKGEYKDVFGSWTDVNVFATNPKIASLINLNPFKFPPSIHVLEHVDGLVEIFSVCWPMYDAMPAFFKNAILKAYEEVGWDLGSSTFEGAGVQYPDFDILAEQLEILINETNYSAEVKGNYIGALVTRVRSLTVGLNKFIFTNEQTPYEELFDQNCILDISRVKSTETKALIMGMMVYILNEYRVDQKSTNNAGLKHVTVLEEAHNLLKNTTGEDSSLVGKSVEMLTNTIAEIRTYGEGFMIVDQSPSSVDISAIKNTNTKIVLRTPEANDRDAVGLSMGLTPDQVNEIAKLPSGVAVVYQNDWISPVLTMVEKANIKEIPYVNSNILNIKSMRVARTEIITMLMDPWFTAAPINQGELISALHSLEVKHENRNMLIRMIVSYHEAGGHMIWNERSLGLLKRMLLDILDVSLERLNLLISKGDVVPIQNLISKKTRELTIKQINQIITVLIK
ncbi:ATP-binding protein [Periweissella fabalis]|uniref:ATP-binding protein n=1 Tax=Periweissella fabalis TaxID=1070421 RepID=A0A7X6S1Z8_9LACO|nr:ATP-binding protein [Periweissella fabalis]MCM0599156.1 ATP-binding protein [Periweissella fabalis]NKZ23435.1 ATP-binding protein [Periweissella fabalis]